MVSDHQFYGGKELAEAIRLLYAAGQTDYSLEPVILVDKNRQPLGRICDGDSVIFCLRRGEREVQLTEAFVDPDFNKFPRFEFKHLPFIILTLYHEKFKDLPVAFAPRKITNTLTEVISRAGLRQLHVSESEKFAHITFFFNGGNNLPFTGEHDVQVPSPRGIPPENNPELSLAQVASEVKAGLLDGYDLIISNFANGDVIGHTQNERAKLQCAEYIDQHLGNVVEAAEACGYTTIITADHGNLEAMYNPDGSHNVSHTENLVPFIITEPRIVNSIPLLPGSLCDVAPTILSILDLDKPGDMTGKCLIKKKDSIKAKKVLLVILDGWGFGTEDDGNPIFLAKTPFWDKLVLTYPCTALRAAGEFVGLKPGKNGNSEAGHMNLGAGRVIEQDDVRLDSALLDGSFVKNEIFLKALNEVRQYQTSLHLICLLSEKSSHGSIDYPLALLQMAKDHRVNKVYIHVILDGRSTKPGSAPSLLEKFERKIAEVGVGKIVTGMGREIALDRDGDYQKTRCAYDALVTGIGIKHIAKYGA